MATKLKAIDGGKKDKKEKGDKKTDRKANKTGDAPKIGDNSKAGRVVDPADLKRCIDRANTLTDDYESVGAEFRSDMKDLIESSANKMGVARKVVRAAIKLQRDELKKQQRYNDLEPSEKDDHDRLMAAAATADAFKGTPFGEYCAMIAERKDPTEQTTEHTDPPEPEKKEEKAAE